MKIAMRIGRILLTTGAIVWAPACLCADQDVRSVVGEIGAIWNDEAKLRDLHVELAGRFNDAPSFEDLRDRHRWVVVVDTRAEVFTRLVAARTTGSEVAHGDVVEVSYTDRYRAKTYEELPRLLRVLCRRADADYESCRSRTRLGPRDEAGDPTRWGR